MKEAISIEIKVAMSLLRFGTRNTFCNVREVVECKI